MNSSLEFDNENLRHKLQELRKANSSLVTENHRLIEMLEEMGHELKTSSSHVQNLEESIESYRSKSQELNGVLTVFEKVSKSSEKDCQKLKQKFDECSHQLAESASLLQSQSVAIESLKNELEDLKNLQTKTEAERNLALDTAEKIQRSYEELQSRFKKTVASSEGEADVLRKEYCKLVEDLESREALIKTLQEDIKNLRAEVNVQKNARRENEQRNTDLRSQMKNQSAKIEKLEQDLDNHKKFKVKNGEMKTLVDQQRKRIASLETEIRGVHAKLSQLESLLQFSKKTSVKSKNSTQNDGTSASFAASRITKNGCRNGELTNIDLEKLAVAENELLQLRVDVLQLARSFTDLSGKELDGILKTVPLDEICFTECRMEKLENETRDHFVTTLANVEKRLSNFESMNARLVSHIAKLNSQLSELQKNGDEQAVKQERELQKRTQQIALLEKQLDDKVQETASHVFEVNRLKTELEQCKANCKAVQMELNAKCEDCRQITSDMNRLKQLHAEHCLELEAQMAIVEKQREEVKIRLEQTEARCRALQQSLSQTIDISNALKADLESCRQLELMVFAMEQQAKEATERAVELEQVLNSLQAEFAAQLESSRVVEDDYRMQLDAKNERVRFCEKQLSKAEEQVRINEEEVARLLKELNTSQTSLREEAEKTEGLERERSLIQAQISELQQRLTQETSRLESLLDKSEEKLEQALEEISGKECRIAELQQKNKDILLEKERTDKLFSELEESDKWRLELEKEQERMNSVAERQQEEIKMQRVMLKEREAAIEDLQGRLVRAYKELQEKTKTDKNSFAEAELLKAEAHTKDSQLAEAVRKAELQDNELGQCRKQLESVRVALTQREEELRRKQTDFETLNEKLQENEWHMRQKTAKIKQLETNLNERLSVMTESEQKLLRFEGALQKNQLNTKQYEKQVGSLEDQVHDLLALIKEQCLKIQKDEATNRQLSVELDGRNSRVQELEQSLSNLQRELQRMMTVNKHAEEELCTSREHIQKMHNELTGARQELASIRLQHDRLAHDLAEAVALLQQKDSELTNLLQTLSGADDCRTRYSEQLQQAEEAYRSLEESYHQDLESLKKVHKDAVAVRDNKNQSLQRDLRAANKQQQNLAKKVSDLVDQITRLQLEYRNSQCVESNTRHAKRVEAELSQGKERASSYSRNISGSTCEIEAAVSGLSRSTSNASLSDTSIFSHSQSSGNLEAELAKTRNSERDNHHCLPRKGWSSTSGIRNSCTEEDCRVAQRELDPHEELDLQAANQNCLSSLTQQSEDNNRSSSNFFQTMWKMLLNSELEDLPVSGNPPVLCSEQDESRVTMCTPVHASNHSASAIDHSASMINQHRSAPAVICSASAINNSDLIVYHLAPAVKCSASSVDHSNSTLPQKDLCRSSQDKPRPQNCSKHDIPSDPRPRQQQAPTPKKSDPLACTTTRLLRSTTKATKNPLKRTTRSPINKSPFSPIFADRHSPNPTTAILYYEKILPMSNSDAEVERFATGRDFGTGGRFSSLSDE